MAVNSNVCLVVTYNKVVKDLINIYNSIPKNEIEEETKIMEYVLKFKNNSGNKFCVD